MPPPHRYLLERRIDRAKELLDHADLPITRIAHELGYASGQHFARSFRQGVGRSPSEFRRRFKTAASPGPDIAQPQAGDSASTGWPPAGREPTEYLQPRRICFATMAMLWGRSHVRLPTGSLALGDGTSRDPTVTFGGDLATMRSTDILLAQPLSFS